MVSVGRREDALVHRIGYGLWDDSDIQRSDDDISPSVCIEVASFGSLTIYAIIEISLPPQDPQFRAVAHPRSTSLREAKTMGARWLNPKPAFARFCHKLTTCELGIGSS